MALFDRFRRQPPQQTPGSALGVQISSPVVPPHMSATGRSTSAPIVAAATRIVEGTGINGAPFRINNTAWSQESWRQYDICGELHFATGWLASGVSRCRIIVADKDPSGKISSGSTKDADVVGLLAGLLNRPDVQAEMLRMAAVNLTVVGDFYLLAEPDETGQYSAWTVLSIQEVFLGIEPGWIIVNVGDGLPRRLDLNECLLMRVHRPHPRRWWEADSPTRAALPILRELEELSKYLFATINSRLAGPGILGLPAEMTHPMPSGDVIPGQSAFMTVFTEAITTAIDDMSHPAALVPIIIEAPAQALAGIQWITNPNGNLTTVISDLRTKAIERLALSLDLAPDTLFGTGNASRWGQWTIEEQSIKHHIEPIVALVCAALNQGWLVPTLEAAGIDSSKYQIWYDASDLVQRADQGTVALDVYDRGELSGEALRRETGFSAADAPAGNEVQIKALLKILALAPQVAPALIPELAKLWGLDVDLDDLVPPTDGTPPQDNAPPKNSNPGDNTAPTKPKGAPKPPNKDGTPPEPGRAAS